MWAQHGYIQCAHNMHLLYRGTGACSAVKIFDLRSLLRPFLATNTIPSVLPVCSLHVHMKAIAHANNWSLTLHVAFHIIFTWAPVNFYVGTDLGMHRYNYATAFTCHTDIIHTFFTQARPNSSGVEMPSSSNVGLTASIM